VPCVPTPCLAQAALKKLSCDQLYSLSGGCLVFLPGTDSCGRSQIFVRSPHADTPCLASWHLPLPCLLAPCLSLPCLASWCLAMPCLPCTFLALRPSTLPFLAPCHLAFPCPTSCFLALPCQAVLKYLPRSQNRFLSVIRLVFLPSSPLCCVVVFVTALCAFRYSSSCVWAPILPTGLALRLRAPLANSPCLGRALRAFGRPSCQLALPFPWSPNLGHAV
jgi:hypothetical protein